MYNHILYLVYWAINGGLILATFLVDPNSVILGNNRMTPWEASIYAGFWLTFVVWSFWDILIAGGVKLGQGFSAWIYFALVNLLGMYLVSSLTKYTGLSIAYPILIVALALLANLIQRFVWTKIYYQNSHK